MCNYNRQLLCALHIRLNAVNVIQFSTETWLPHQPVIIWYHSVFERFMFSFFVHPLATDRASEWTYGEWHQSKSCNPSNQIQFMHRKTIELWKHTSNHRLNFHTAQKISSTFSASCSVHMWVLFNALLRLELHHCLIQPHFHLMKCSLDSCHAARQNVSRLYVGLSFFLHLCKNAEPKVMEKQAEARKMGLMSKSLRE